MTRSWKKIIRNDKELEDRSKEDVKELEKGELMYNHKDTDLRIYQDSGLSLVPAGFLTVQFLQKR